MFVIECRDRASRHAGAAGQTRRHLAWIDADTQDLHLPVCAPKDLERAVWPVAPTVAGSEQLVPGILACWVSEESAGGEVRVVAVAEA